MRRLNLPLYLLLICLLWSNNLRAVTIRPTDQVTIAARTIYNDGNLTQPDSVRIQVFRNGSELSDNWYNSSDAECSAVDGWLIFTDQFQDIDGAGGQGHYLIMGRAYDNDSTLYTPWVYNFDVGMWGSIDNIEDTLEAYDSAGRFQADIQEVLDTLQTYDAAGRFQNDIQEVLDTLQNQDEWVARNQYIDTEIQEILDTLQTYDNANRFQADVQAALDTLQNHDDWVAGDANVSEVLDTLQVYDDAGRFQSDAQEILDTLQSHDGWVAKEATVAGLNDIAAIDVWDVSFGAAFAAGSMGDSLNNPTYVQGSASGDWALGEKENIRDALGVTGTKTTASGGQLQDVLDSLNAALDTLRDQNSWVAKEATVNGLNDFDPLTDSVMVDMSAFNSNLKGSTAGRAFLSLAPHFGWVTSQVSTSQFKVGGPMTAYGDDYFNDLQLIFIDGNLPGRASRVTDWSSSDSTITVNPFSSQPAVFDTFAVAPNLDISASADIPDSIAARIDSILASTGIFSDASITAKLGSYSGAPGDNNNIKDDIAAISTQGGGTEAETLFVFDSDTTAIEGVSVTVRNLDQTSTKVPGNRTDTSGRLLLELDPDSFVVALYANNYIQYGLDTIVVATGGGTDTLWMNLFDPGNPPSPDLCRVYGWVYDITGDSLEGVTVTSEIPPDYHPVKYSNVIITPFKKTAKTDSTGYWQIDLFPNSVLSDIDSKYMFIIEYPSGIVFKTRVEVPDSASWQLK